MKKAVRVLFAALLSVSVLGILAGCGGASAEETIKSISMTQQKTSNVTQDNYSVNLTYTTTQWMELSDEKKAEVANLGYEKAVEKLEANSSSNFNILGMTSTGEDGSSSQVIFMLNHETSKLAVYSGESTDGKPNLVRELDVKYPLS